MSFFDDAIAEIPGRRLLRSRAKSSRRPDRRDEAIAAWHEALDRYERKGVIPLARRTRKRIAALQESPA